MARWTTGPQVRGYVRMSPRPVALLEQMSSIELALATPHLRIYRVDPLTGRADTGGQRGLMFDLIETPRVDDPSGQFLERPLVSLVSAKVSSRLDLGDQSFRDIELSFRVHRPDLIFSRDSDVPWRQLLVEGESFVLEYGWALNPTDVKNDLLNGMGFFDRTAGIVVPSQRSLLFMVVTYSINIAQNGEADVQVRALENGNRALREARFADIAEDAWWIGGGQPDTSRDGSPASRQARWEGGIKRLLDGVPAQKMDVRGEFYRMGDILDQMLAPVVERACRAFGYGGVDLYCGNFNPWAPRQSENHGGRDMSGERSIAEFLVPAKEFRRDLARFLAAGKDLQVQNFLGQVINKINSVDAWAPPSDPSKEKPYVVLRGDDLVLPDGTRRFVLRLLDLQEALRVFKGAKPIPVREQTRERIFDRVRTAGVPILELGRADSFILGAGFEFQPDAQLQGVQIDISNRARKDRAQMNMQPDIVGRRGLMTPREFQFPISIMKGDVQMVGNFVFDNLSPAWLEYYGASAVSGLFTCKSKVDELGPGFFRTTVELMSEGLDPLNTRHRRSDEELRQVQENEDARRNRTKR